MKEMKVIKGAREFIIEINGDGLVVSEGEESVRAICYADSTIVKFPNPNPNISHNGAALEGLSISMQQSRELGRLRSELRQRNNEEKDKTRSVPDFVRFSFGESFQVRVSTKNVKYDFLRKIVTISYDWLKGNSSVAGETSDDYAIYEIETALVEEYVRECEKKASLRKKDIEGRIAYNACWECGRVKIVGWIKDGKTQLIPREQYTEIKAVFDKAWKGQFNGGMQWMSALAKAGYRTIKIETIYCGC